jgi:hypothetical protein
MRWAACTVALAVALAAASGAQAAVPALSVDVDRTALETEIGQTFPLRTTIRNESSSPTPELVAHLNILALQPGTYVDPEDWSTERTRYVPSIPAGGSATLPWRVTAVHSGPIGVFVSVLPANGSGRPVAGDTLRADITARTTIDSGGVVPLALGVPAVLVVLIFAVGLRRRR